MATVWSIAFRPEALDVYDLTNQKHFFKQILS